MTLKSLARKLYYGLPKHATAGLMPPCRNVTMEMTYRCNLRCEMCYIFVEEGEFGLNHKGRPDLETEEVLDVIGQFPRGSNFQLTGGEVFIRKDIEQILGAMLARHRVTIATNGMLLTDDLVRLLVEQGLRTLSMSVDGPEDMHDRVRRREGSFRDLTETMRKVLARRASYGSSRPHTNFNCVILPTNYRRLPEVVEHAGRVGVDSCSFQLLDASLSRTGLRLQDEVATRETPLASVPRLPRSELGERLERVLEIGARRGVDVGFTPKGMGLEEVLDYYDRKFDFSNWTCDLPWTTIRISPYGDVFPCLNYRIGSVKETPVWRLWNSRAYRHFRSIFKEEELTPSCVGCCKMRRKQAS